MGFVSDLANDLLSLARAVVNSVMDTINSQINTIADSVTSPLKSFVNQVTGGIWKGDGADRFVQEMTSEVIPALVNIANVSFNFGNILGQAVSLIDTAESTASNLANSLLDTFNSIINF
jgi:phage-related protein